MVGVAQYRVRGKLFAPRSDQQIDTVFEASSAGDAVVQLWRQVKRRRGQVGPDEVRISSLRISRLEDGREIVEVDDFWVSGGSTA